MSAGDMSCPFQSKSEESPALLPCHIAWQQPGTLAAAPTASQLRRARRTNLPSTAAPATPAMPGRRRLCPGESCCQQQLCHRRGLPGGFACAKSRSADFREGSVTFQAPSSECWCRTQQLWIDSQGYKHLPLSCRVVLGKQKGTRGEARGYHSSFALSPTLQALPPRLLYPNLSLFFFFLLNSMILKVFMQFVPLAAPMSGAQHFPSWDDLLREYSSSPSVEWLVASFLLLERGLGLLQHDFPNMDMCQLGSRAARTFPD